MLEYKWQLSIHITRVSNGVVCFVRNSEHYDFKWSLTSSRHSWWVLYTIGKLENSSFTFILTIFHKMQILRSYCQMKIWSWLAKQWPRRQTRATMTTAASKWQQIDVKRQTIITAIKSIARGCRKSINFNFWKWKKSLKFAFHGKCLL